MMMGPRTESLVILLLVSRCSPALPDLGLVEESLSDLDLNSLGRDFSQIYTGWVNSSFIYPYYLKGSSIFNDVYGSVNRTGLVIAGAALVGVSGLAFLGELNAIPNVDGVADSVKGFQGFMEGVVSRFQSSIKSSVSTLQSFKPTGLDTVDRADTVYTLPGPPYNYDLEAMRNLTEGNSETSNRKSDSGSETSTEIVSIDKYFENLDKEEALTALNNILGRDKSVTTTEAFNLDQIGRPETFYEEDHSDLENWIDVDFKPSELLYEPEPEIGEEKFDYYSRGNYKLKPLYQNDFFYSKPIPINQIENPVRPKYYDTRKKSFNKYQPKNVQMYKKKDYPMTKNVQSFKHTFPVKKSVPPFKSSPKLSSYHRGHKSKQPPNYDPYIRDFNRRKPFRRKETYPPRRYYQKGFQKQF